MLRHHVQSRRLLGSDAPWRKLVSSRPRWSLSDQRLHNVSGADCGFAMSPVHIEFSPRLPPSGIARRMSCSQRNLALRIADER